MSTLTSQQTFKALCSHLCRHLCRPLRHPLRRPPVRPFSSSHVGSLQAPYSGYDALARRFSTYPNPVNFFALKSRQKATNSSEYADIHELRDISDLELNIMTF